MNISKNIGILDKTVSCNSKEYEDLSNRTFVFNSLDIARCIKNEAYIEKFTKLLLNCKNFVGFAMIPKDKQFVSNLFEMNKINVIAIGDGNNDIPMLKCATVGVGIKNGLNSNVVSNSQITISTFSDLNKVEKDSEFSYNHNFNSIYSVFYKIIMIHTLVYFFIQENNYDLNNVLFNFVEIQGNHLLWGIIPVIVGNLRYYNTIVIDKCEIIKISILLAFINSLIIIKLKNYITIDLTIKRIILLLSIISINSKFILIFGIRTINILSCIISCLIGVYYVFYL